MIANQLMEDTDNNMGQLKQYYTNCFYETCQDFGIPINEKLIEEKTNKKIEEVNNVLNNGLDIGGIIQYIVPVNSIKFIDDKPYFYSPKTKKSYLII